jgi:hypothetical protein
MCFIINLIQMSVSQSLTSSFKSQLSAVIPAIIYSGSISITKILTIILLVVLQELFQNHVLIYERIIEYFYGHSNNNFYVKIYSHDLKKGEEINPLYFRLLYWIDYLDKTEHNGIYCDESIYTKQRKSGSWNFEVDLLASNINYKFFTPHGTTINIKYKDFDFEISKNNKTSNDEKNSTIEYITLQTNESHDAIRRFIEDGLRYYKAEANQYFKNKVLIFGHQKREGWLHNEMKINKNFDNVFLPLSARKILETVAYKFPEMESIYDLSGTPFKKGLLLHGIPGSGKSSIIYALASSMKRNIYFLPRGNYEDEEYRNMIATIPDGQIVVLEEIDTLDSMTKNRKIDYDADQYITLNELIHQSTISELNKNKDTNNNDESKSKNSNQLALYLEILDGYNCLRNTIVIMTTNCIKNIDPAIYRPGRFDHLIHLSYANETQITEISNFYNLKLDEKQILKIYKSKITTGYLINTCILPYIKDDNNDEIIKSIMFYCDSSAYNIE